ncbi:hypothetical protein [Rhodococcoides fascians]|uniref:hypothetical protein n=1 Tax=Rhodococcoides fascians TaxID=1828 RepID=UPI00050CCDD6|nr:hypothetical protein [Rhodococcus fascians]
MGIYADPEMERLVGIEDWLEIIHWRLAGAPSDRVPIGVVAGTRKAQQAIDAPPKKVAKVADIREEYERRQRGEHPTSSKKPVNPRAQQIRDELALRFGTAQ